MSTDSRERDLGIILRFYEDSRLIMFNVAASDTVECLIQLIRQSVITGDSSFASPEMVRDDAMFLFRGKDLRNEDASCTLLSLGMDRRAEIFVFHPGPLVRGSALSKNSNLFALVKNAKRAIDTGITANEFLEIDKTSRDRKIVFVEIPISECMNFTISVKMKLADPIDVVKGIVECTILPTCTGGNLQESCRRLGSFDLLFNNIKLSPKSTLAGCGIKEHDKLKLLWHFNGIGISVPLQINDRLFPRIMKMDSFHTVGKVKARIHQVTGIPPEKQLVRYQNRWLGDDFLSHEECGICSFSGDISRWRPQIGALHIFPMPTEANIEGFPSLKVPVPCPAGIMHGFKILPWHIWAENGGFLSQKKRRTEDALGNRENGVSGERFAPRKKLRLWVENALEVRASPNGVLDGEWQELITPEDEV